MLKHVADGVWPFSEDEIHPELRFTGAGSWQWQNSGQAPMVGDLPVVLVSLLGLPSGAIVVDSMNSNVKNRRLPILHHFCSVSCDIFVRQNRTVYSHVF